MGGGAAGAQNLGIPADVILERFLTVVGIILDPHFYFVHCTGGTRSRKPFKSGLVKDD